MHISGNIIVEPNAVREPNGIGAAVKDVNRGTVGNTIAGAIGGGLGGQALQALIPALAGAAGSGPGGGASGVVLTAIVGLIKNKMT